MFQSFANLYDFYSFIEKCPLCKKRTTPYCVFPRGSLVAETKSKLDNKYLTLLDSSEKEIHSVDIKNNIFYTDYDLIGDLVDASTNQLTFIIGRECRKYHFYYAGLATLNIQAKHIEQIELDRLHFIRICGNTHFAVSNSYTAQTTNVRITNSNYKTREIILPQIEFDLTSNRKTFKKLKNIELLA